MNKKQYQWYDHAKFIIPSIIGIFLFMSPVKTADGFTIPIAILANWIEELLAKQVSAMRVIIIVLTALCTVLSKCRELQLFARTPFFQNLFNVTPFWAITRVIAAIFAVMVFFEIGPEAIYGENTGQELLDGLLHTLFAFFLFAGLFLPLLFNFCFFVFFGTLMSLIMI